MFVVSLTVLRNHEKVQCMWTTCLLQLIVVSVLSECCVYAGAGAVNRLVQQCDCLACQCRISSQPTATVMASPRVLRYLASPLLCYWHKIHRAPGSQTLLPSHYFHLKFQKFPRGTCWPLWQSSGKGQPSHTHPTTALPQCTCAQ